MARNLTGVAGAFHDCSRGRAAHVAAPCRAGQAQAAKRLLGSFAAAEIARMVKLTNLSRTLPIEYLVCIILFLVEDGNGGIN